MNVLNPCEASFGTRPWVWLLLVVVTGACGGCGRDSLEPSAPSASAPAATAATTHAEHGYWGIKLVDPAAAPLVIQGFVAGSSAARCGLRPGDVILRVERTWDPSGEQMQNVAAIRPPGQVMGIRVQRGQEELEYQVMLVSEEFIQRSMEQAQQVGS